jgi:hypothetical protein
VISREHLNEAMKISLWAAEFSYNAIPRYFSNILGVSSTLKILPPYKLLELLNRYLIKDIYDLPLAFGCNSLIEEYHIAETSRFKETIIGLLNRVRYNRPIVIFLKGPR